MSFLNSELEFPNGDLIPKKETKIDSFLLQYPDYNGNGIIIAVIDSGVDPGEKGLKKTSKGEVKILKRLDCTGSGDVSLSESLEPTAGILVGVTGRRLKIPNDWSNPTGKYKIGCKNPYDFYNKDLKDKIQENYKEKWMRKTTILLDETLGILNNFDEKYSTELSNEIKLQKEDLEAKIEVLKTLKEKFEDIGPTYDCIVFHDGSKWNACIDITEEGDLEKCNVLGEYEVTHEYASLSDQLNYTINVNNDGKLLEIVGISSLKGTNISLMAAGYFEDDSDKNGIAPGAQIVSLTVCDNRLNSKISTSALVRALIEIIELAKKRPVIIHCNHGIRSHFSPNNQISDLINEIVDKYQCIWVSDVGQNGPALSTVTLPPSVNQDTVIGVGSFVSSEMMSAVHSLKEKLFSTIYTFSSRGPFVDGNFGVSICAPGDSIFSYSSKSNESNSLASAYVAGAVALLLNGIISKQQKYSSFAVKRALENGATFLSDTEIFAQGNGLLNVENSFKLLENYDSSSKLNIRFEIKCGSDNYKGIYMFCTDSNASQEWSVNIEPKFADKALNSEKIDFNLKLILECNADFVSYPKYLSVSNIARTISIRVDAKSLKPGAYTTNICAFNTKNRSCGADFKIPVTVIKSELIDESNYTYTSKRKLFSPNSIKRHFFKVPEKATWAVFNLNCLDTPEINGQFTLHCMQVLPKKINKTLEAKFNLNVSSNTDNVKSFRVEGGFHLEVTLAKNWNSLGDMNVQYSISFYGIKPNKPCLNMIAVEGIHRIDLTTLRGEEISPSLTLDHSFRILDPTEPKVKPLSLKDVIPPGKQIYELLQTYCFNLIKPAKVTLKNSYLKDALHLTEFESHFWMLYNNNKQLLGCGDAGCNENFVHLEKGTYVVKSQIRHSVREKLDKMMNAPLLLKMKLTNPVAMDVYSSYTAALLNEKKNDGFQKFLYSCSIPIFIGSLTSDKYNVKTNNSADYLMGNITFAKSELGKVDAYPIKYTLHKGEATKKTPENKSNKTKLEEYKEVVKDFKTAWIKKMDELEEVETIFQEIEKEFPSDLQSKIYMLRVLQPLEPKVQLPTLKEEEIRKCKVDELQSKILPLCEKILRNLDQDEILRYYATKTDPKSDVKVQELMKLKKNALIESLCHKGIAISRLYQYSLINTDFCFEHKPNLSDISEIWEAMCKFVDFKDKNLDVAVFYFAFWHAAINKNYGRLFKYLLKYQEDKPNKEIDEKCSEICDLLEWYHIAKHLQRILPSKYPKNFCNF